MIYKVNCKLGSCNSLLDEKTRIVPICNSCVDQIMSEIKTKCGNDFILRVAAEGNCDLPPKTLDELKHFIMRRKLHISSSRHKPSLGAERK